MKPALIIVDIQNDFLPGGALAVKDGDTIIPLVNQLMDKFEIVVATQDWHPNDHGSFASNHQGKSVGDLIELNGLQQILWPSHCVQESFGAEFSQELKADKITCIFQKGTDPGIDSYSGFFDNGKQKSTGLDQYLKNLGVQQVYVVGLATDYCVKFTATDAAELGFETIVIRDATKAVNLREGDDERAFEEMKSKGIQVLNSSELLI